jgi:hypothetical protein
MHDIEPFLILKFVIGLISSSPVIVKVYVMLQSFRLYGLWNLYQNKKQIYNHNIFKLLDHLSTDEELFNRIPDSARREIFKDVFKGKVSSIMDILLHFRETIYFKDSLFQFLRHQRYLDNSQLMHLFIRLYNAHRDKLNKIIIRKLRFNELDKDKAVYVAQKFYEFTAELSFCLRKRINQLAGRKNMLFCILDVLDALEIHIEAEKLFLTEQFLSLNGKLNGVTYKGYDSLEMTNHKVKAIKGEH